MCRFHRSSVRRSPPSTHHWTTTPTNRTHRLRPHHRYPSHAGTKPPLPRHKSAPDHWMSRFHRCLAHPSPPPTHHWTTTPTNQIRLVRPHHRYPNHAGTKPPRPRQTPAPDHYWCRFHRSSVRRSPPPTHHWTTTPTNRTRRMRPHHRYPKLVGPNHQQLTRPEPPTSRGSKASERGRRCVQH